MKYFKYWVKETCNISLAGQPQSINLLMGSNISKQAASDEAQSCAQLIEQRIARGERKTEYESAIKEYVKEIINDSNIITVCRYGAQVLNTTQYTILDLDDYPVDFMDFFKPLGKLSKKARIVYKFEQRLKKFPELGKRFRIYETAKGVRVIAKTYIAPRSQDFLKLMRKLGVDCIYIDLCRKQNCYRARLTPKPYRMKINTIKVKSPLDCETESYANWAESYQVASQGFSVVKIIKTLGDSFANDPIIKLHDERCNLGATHRLA